MMKKTKEINEYNKRAKGKRKKGEERMDKQTGGIMSGVNTC